MTLHKYLGFATISLRQALADRGELLGRATYFVVILGVFSSLWRAVSEVGLPIAADPKHLVWYLAVTEWVVLSAPQLHIDIQRDIQRGDIAYQLPRPVSYLGALLSQGLGALCVRAPTLGVLAFGSAFALTQTVPPARVLLLVLPFALLSMAILMALYVLLGLLAFWLTDVTPVYWVFQKALFVLGGLMLPLDFYPEWLLRLAWLTPFPALLYGPANLVLSPQSPTTSLALLATIWTLFTSTALLVVFRLATRSLHVKGG